jgi:hypothetical protein
LGVKFPVALNTSFLFCGDWNVVQNKSDDTYNVIHDRNQNARKKIEELKETFELLERQKN